MSDDRLTLGPALAPDPERARRRANVELRRFQLVHFLQLPIVLGVSGAVSWAIFSLPAPIGLYAGLLLLPLILLTLRVLRDSAWGVYLIYFIEIYRPQHLVPALVALSLSQTVLIVVSVVFLIRFFTVKRRRIVWTAHSTAFALLVGCMGATTFTAVNTFDAYFRSQATAMTLLAYVLMTNLVETRAQFSRLVRSLLVMYLLLTVEGLYGYLRRGSSAFSQIAGSFLGDENDFALAVLVFLPFAYYGMVLWRRGWQRILAGAAFIVLVLGVVLSFSRGGAVGLATVLVFCIWRSRRRVPVLIGVGLLVALALGLAPPTYWSEIRSIKNTNEGTARARRLYWTAGWRMYVSHPVFGVGYGNSGRQLPNYFPGPNAGRHWKRALHSTYYELLAELGTIGAVVYASMVLAVLRSLRRVEGVKGLPPDAERERDYVVRSIRGGLVGYFTAAAFVSTLGYPHVYILTGLAALTQIHYGRHTVGAVAPAPTAT
jgi:probable O-glycosylation ligase (exosortase A-associated)